MSLGSASPVTNQLEQEESFTGISLQSIPSSIVEALVGDKTFFEELVNEVTMSRTSPHSAMLPIASNKGVDFNSELCKLNALRTVTSELDNSQRQAREQLQKLRTFWNIGGNAPSSKDIGRTPSKVFIDTKGQNKNVSFEIRALCYGHRRCSSYDHISLVELNFPLSTLLECVKDVCN